MDPVKPQTLTRRQHEITALVAKSLSNKEIARVLKITEGTVKIRLHAIYSKLAVPNRTALALSTLTPATPENLTSRASQGARLVA
jgi:two-component system, NarL family, nitrate/nitrite response regulator NarL